MREYKTEAELCAAFIKHNSEEWQAYQETSGFDILMVRKSDGFQIGVEAKLRLNAKVICQIAEPNSTYLTTSEGPDCRAVLIPYGKSSELAALLPLLHITPIFFGEEDSYGGRMTVHQYKSLPRVSQYSYDDHDWYELCPSKRCDLPPCIPESKAGTPCPITLTPWKVKAIKLVVILEKKGFVTRKDFKALDLSMTVWTQKNWIRLDENRKVWVSGGLPDIRSKHPMNFVDIENNYEQWIKEICHE